MIFSRIIKIFFNKTFAFWQMLGWHIVPVHFYSPLPNTRALDNDVWQKEFNAGINWQEKNQISLLENLAHAFRGEYENLQNFSQNTEFGPVDKETLYSLVRFLKPKKVIEVGFGYSTLIIKQALKENRKGELLSIDPYPKKNLENDSLEIIKQEVQNVSLAEFETLDSGDILFIDSSHIVKCNSDVQYLFLEVLPRLKNGVWVHIHDIFLPAEYPKNWIVKEHRFFNEQYILQAFLMFNNAFEIKLANSFLHVKHPDLLKKHFHSYHPINNWPGSFWICKIT